MNITFESIMNFLCSKITKVSTIVGSFAYTILAACTFYFMDITNKLEAYKKNTDPDTADSQGLDTIVKQKGLVRHEATKGIARGKFDKEIPIGARFQLNEIIWVCKEHIEDIEDYFYYSMESEQVGSQVNKAVGQLTPITYVEGLEYAYIEEISIPAEDTESDEELKKRYDESFSTQSYGGNKSAYRDMCHSMDGVGGCKIFGTWMGGGTVRISIISSDYESPSSELIDRVQEFIDPDKTGEGDGNAPFGAKVTITGVNNSDIKIGLKCQFSSGTFDDWKEIIKGIIERYFLSLNKTWENGTITIRKAEMIAELIKDEHITDVLNLEINDSDENVELDADEIAHLDELVEIV